MPPVKMTRATDTGCAGGAGPVGRATTRDHPLLWTMRIGVPRMLPGLSGGTIRSPGLVQATLWLGNALRSRECVGLILVRARLPERYNERSFIWKVLSSQFTSQARLVRL
jgi:hypothetical protein